MTQLTKTKPILNVAGDYVTITAQETNQLIGYFLKEGNSYVFKHNPEFQLTDDTNEFITEELKLINQS